MGGLSVSELGTSDRRDSSRMGAKRIHLPVLPLDVDEFLDARDVEEGVHILLVRSQCHRLAFALGGFLRGFEESVPSCGGGGLHTFSLAAVRQCLLISVIGLNSWGSNHKNADEDGVFWCDVDAFALASERWGNRRICPLDIIIRSEPTFFGSTLGTKRYIMIRSPNRSRDALVGSWKEATRDNASIGLFSGKNAL